MRALALGVCVFLLLIATPTFIPLGEHDRDGEIELYLLSNQIHVGLMVPVRNEVFDWHSFLDPADFAQTGDWLQFGWGDRTFYFEVPELSDLTLRIAFEALVIPDRAIMHVDHILESPKTIDAARPFRVSRAGYTRMVEEIQSRFRLRDNRPEAIPQRSYYGTDRFFEGEGTYSIYRTCNVWTAEILGLVGLRRPLWSPTKYGLELLYPTQR